MPIDRYRSLSSAVVCRLPIDRFRCPSREYGTGTTLRYRTVDLWFCSVANIINMFIIQNSHDASKSRICHMHTTIQEQKFEVIMFTLGSLTPFCLRLRKPRTFATSTSIRTQFAGEAWHPSMPRYRQPVIILLSRCGNMLNPLESGLNQRN